MGIFIFKITWYMEYSLIWNIDDICQNSHHMQYCMQCAQLDLQFTVTNELKIHVNASQDFLYLFE